MSKLILTRDAAGRALYRSDGKPRRKRGHVHDDILLNVRKIVLAHGGQFWRTHQGGGMMLRNGRAPLRGDPGVMDGCGVFVGERVRWSKTSPENPFAFWFDAKYGRDKPTPEQLEFEAAWNGAGVESVFGGVDDVVVFLRSRGVDVHISGERATP